MTDQAIPNFSELIETCQLDEPAITVFNLYPAQCAIRGHYGRRYHVMTEALLDVKALWQIEPDDGTINEHGVFTQKERFRFCAGRYQADFALAGTTSGL